MRKPTRPLARRIDERQPVPYQQRSPEPVFCTENERCRGCPYPAHGVICWHRDGTCLRTDKELALRLAGMQYSTIGSSEYESQRLRHLFTAAAPMAEIDAELLKSAVSQIYVKKGQTSLLLKNGQIIERSA